MSSAALPRPSTKDVLRYRYQHGTNLGGIFVLEKWLFPKMFHASSAGNSEFDAVVASLNVYGLGETKKRWEAHWSSALTGEDLQWLTKTAHCNCIRLPIGYFTLGPDFCGNTPFAREVAEVYVNAWSTVISIIQSCLQFGIGVLIDLHSLPGGANIGAHSGTSSGVAELWGNKFNLDLATRCLEFIAQQIASNSWGRGVVGLGICNEADSNAPGMYDWYTEVVTKLSLIDPSLPIYISDAWQLPRALEFSKKMNRLSDLPKCPVIVDSHQYFLFAKHHNDKSVDAIIEHLPTNLHQVDGCSKKDSIFKSRTAAAVFVGEYSCVLSESSWKKSSKDTRTARTKQFGIRQNQLYQSVCSGAAFWTYRMDWMDGGGWGFRQQVHAGAVVPPRNMTYSKITIQGKVDRADERRNELFRKAFESHSTYWDKRDLKGHQNHWRYPMGWSQGWTDGRDFFLARVREVVPSHSESDEVVNAVMPFSTDGSVESIVPTVEAAGGLNRSVVGADLIGAIDLWLLKRMTEADMMDRKECPFGWEWERGFRAGLKAFHSVVMVDGE